MSICAAMERVLRPRVLTCFYALVLAIPVIARAESEDPFVPGNEIRATVDGNPVRGLLAAADADAVQLVQRSGAKIREFPRAALLDVVVRPAASLGVGASLSILTTDNALESGIVTAIDATGIRLRDDEGLSETELPWERVQAFARVHRAPPAAGIELVLGDEIVLGRTLGGVYRGLVASSDAEVISLKVGGVDRPIRFE